MAACALCRGREGDPELFREEVWSDHLWRLTTSVEGAIPGFSYLEPRRHIPHLTDLDGEEASTLGVVLSRTTRALKAATRADLVYAYVFGGGIPHLHIHLAPHRDGDALNEQILRGNVTSETLPSGATRIVSKDFPPRPRQELQATVERIRGLLTAD